MKIQVLKTGNSKTRITGPCPYLVEMPPEAAKK
jgi:hypothetical protein